MKASILSTSNARLLRAAMRSFPPADRSFLTEWGTPDRALAFVREAVRQGTEGCVQDYRIFGDPWGFSLEEIGVPVQIWEGADDRTGPPGYRDFLQAHIAHATVTVVPGRRPPVPAAPSGARHLRRAARRRPQRRVDGAVERGVGEDHRPQRLERDLGVDGQGEQAEHLAAARGHGRGADEHAVTRHELDEALAAVDPAAGGLGRPAPATR